MPFGRSARFQADQGWMRYVIQCQEPHAANADKACEKSYDQSKSDEDQAPDIYEIDDL